MTDQADPIEAMNAAGHASLGMTSLYTLPDFPRQAAHVDASGSREAVGRP